MGCGISTSNLPYFMQSGRSSSTRRTRPLGWRHDDHEDDDQNIAIIHHNNNNNNNISPTASDHEENDDSNHGQKVSVSPPHANNTRKINNGDIKKEDEIRNNTQNIIKGEEEKDDETRNKTSISTDLEKEKNNRDNREELGDEYGRDDNIDDLPWVGSPSFRDYCVNRSIDFDGNSDRGNMETKTQGGHSDAFPKPNEESIERRRGSRFRKVFPVAKSSAMKNILSVATCYNSNHATSRVGHEK